MRIRVEDIEITLPRKTDGLVFVDAEVSDPALATH